MTNKEQSLDNLVNKSHLLNSEFRERKGVLYRVIHDQEIRFVEVKQGLYAWTGVHYVGRPVEKYEEEQDITPTKEWKDEMDARFRGVQ
jgi:hypothetical protein